MLLVATITVGASPAVAVPSAPNAEGEFLNLINQERSRAGLTPLVHDTATAGVARDWSGHMASTGVLAHRPDMAAAISQRVTNQWTRIGENVGRGGSVGVLHQAFMNSSGHRANVMGAYNRVGVGVVISGSTVWVTVNFVNGPAIPGVTRAATGPPPSGDLWLVSSGGEVWGFGTARQMGSLAGARLHRPIVGMASTPTGLGYWLVASDGGVFSFGDARFHGSTGNLALSRPIVGMAATPSGNGYWLVASDGGIFSFGDARFKGSTGRMRLSRPVLGMAATPSGNGYWLVASDGGIFSFGDARFLGSTGHLRLNSPIAGMARTPGGHGYWLVARDGGVFTFGTAAFMGSAAAGTSAPVRSIGASPSGHGYRLFAEDGRVYPFGDAGSGASGTVGGARPIVAGSVKAA